MKSQSLTHAKLREMETTNGTVGCGFFLVKSAVKFPESSEPSRKEQHQYRVVNLAGAVVHFLTQARMHLNSLNDRELRLLQLAKSRPLWVLGPERGFTARAVLLV